MLPPRRWGIKWGIESELDSWAARQLRSRLLLFLSAMTFTSRLRKFVESRTGATDTQEYLPQTLVNDLILLMNDCLVEVRKLVAVAIADEKRLRRQWDVELALSQRMEEKARGADNNAPVDLVSQSTTLAAEHKRMAERYHAQWQSQRDSVEVLRNKLRRLNNMVEACKREKGVLVAQKNVEEAERTIAVATRAVENAERFLKILIKGVELQSAVTRRASTTLHSFDFIIEDLNQVIRLILSMFGAPVSELDDVSPTP